MATRGAAAPEAEASYVHANEVCERLEDTARLFPVLGGLWYCNYGRGRYRTARELGERLLRIAEGDRRLEAHHSLWATLVGMGEAMLARTHLEQGLALYDPARHGGEAQLFGAHDPGVCCRWFSAVALWQLGYPDQALEALQGALRLARDLGHPLTTTMATYFAALIHFLRGEPRAALDSAEAAVTQATAQEAADWARAGTALLGGLMIENGRVEEGIARLERVLTAAWGWRRIVALGFLADAFRRQGEPERALEPLAEALTMAERDTVGFHEPELHRLKGELLQLQMPGDAGTRRHASTGRSRSPGPGSRNPWSCARR